MSDAPGTWGTPGIEPEAPQTTPQTTPTTPTPPWAEGGGVQPDGGGVEPDAAQSAQSGDTPGSTPGSTPLDRDMLQQLADRIYAHVDRRIDSAIGDAVQNITASEINGVYEQIGQIGEWSQNIEAAIADLYERLNEVLTGVGDEQTKRRYRMQIISEAAVLGVTPAEITRARKNMKGGDEDE